jgi:hypothetical protein
VAGERPQNHSGLCRAAAGVVGAEQAGQTGILEMAPGARVERIGQSTMADPGLEGALANVIGQLSKIGEIVCATGEDATTQDAHQKYCPLFAQALIATPSRGRPCRATLRSFRHGG